MRGNKQALVLAICFGLAARAVWGVPTKDDIDHAVKGGVAYLRSLQQREGNWHYKETNESGATSLAALALLECDVPKDDKAIVAATEYVRQRAATMTQTYS